MGCDEAPPPDLPGQAAARLDACRAAHVRLGEDPARCDVLENVIAREHADTRPQFTTLTACQVQFGADACEGDAPPVMRAAWRPRLAGWTRLPDKPDALLPAIRARDGQVWSLPEPVTPSAGTSGTLVPPRAISAPELPADFAAPDAARLTFDRVAPMYADQGACTEQWQACDALTLPVVNRFVTQASCQASWTRCIEVDLADAVLPATAAQEPTARSNGGRGYWWGGYNSYWYGAYGRGIGPRYQGWTWTGDRRPVAAYRPTRGTGPLRAWDSGANRLGVAGQMGAYSGRTTTTTRIGTSGVTRPATSISRAGFGSTGRAYSSGG